MLSIELVPYDKNLNNVVDNINIGKECLGKKGLHFIERGSGEQLINFMNKIRRLSRLTDSFQAPNLISLTTVSPSDAHTSASQHSKFKEQPQNHDSGESPNPILHQLNLKNVNT